LSDSVKNSIRLKFLHQNNKDKNGYQYGVARVKYDKSGKLEECYWTLSDSSDVDSAIAEYYGSLDSSKYYIQPDENGFDFVNRVVTDVAKNMVAEIVNIPITGGIKLDQALATKDATNQVSSEARDASFATKDGEQL